MANTQIYNAETVNNLATVFPRRNEHSYARGSVSSLYLNLPGLRAYYPMGAHKVVAGDVFARDIACGFDAQLSAADVQFGNDGINQMATFVSGGTMTYPNDAQFQITGTENYIAEPGLTVGTWVRFRNVAAGVEQAILGKTNTTLNDRGYWLGKDVDDQALFTISQDGAASTPAAFNAPMTMEEWHFICGVAYASDSSLDIWQDNGRVRYLFGIPSIFNSSQDLTIGYYEDGADFFLDADLAHLFVCAYALPSVAVKTLQQLTRPLFYGT